MPATFGTNAIRIGFTAVPAGSSPPQPVSPNTMPKASTVATTSFFVGPRISTPKSRNYLKTSRSVCARWRPPAKLRSSVTPVNRMSAKGYGSEFIDLG
ncbi:hypothetical protein GCM10017790_62620 [Amycolatopsis oliviviridis]|uniref:Uncharacterized protein n=1 Tax=Amycolatopsis oliviviridis TaxID=1471590 RepID=A0ABQ3M2J0_9PSEU|nr:hypothetical protein GCM10017790_62620 [Amycolatopsis oliviviridis]